MFGGHIYYPSEVLKALIGIRDRSVEKFPSNCGSVIQSNTLENEPHIIVEQGEKIDKVIARNLSDKCMPRIVYKSDGRLYPQQIEYGECSAGQRKENENCLVTFNLRESGEVDISIQSSCRGVPLESLSVKAVVFQLSPRWWDDVFTTSQNPYIELGDDEIAYYVAPGVDSPALKRALYKAIALTLHMGFPIVFEAMGAELDVRISDDVTIPYGKWLAEYLSGVFREFPDMVDLVSPEQFSVFLKIDQLAPRKLHEITVEYQKQMDRLTYVEKLTVTSLLDFNSRTLALNRVPRALYPEMCACVFVDKCNPKPCPPYNSGLDVLDIELQKSLLAESLSFGGGPKYAITFVDVGQAKCPYAIATQFSGALFLRGMPGSVQFQYMRSYDQSERRGCVMFQSRDTTDLMANAVAMAAAMAFGNYLVIPIGCPIDRICAIVKAACQHGSKLLCLRQRRFAEHVTVSWIVLVGEADTRKEELKAAAEVLAATLESFRWKGKGVKYALTVNEVRKLVAGATDGLPREGGVYLRHVVSAFSAMNDYWDYYQ